MKRRSTQKKIKPTIISNAEWSKWELTPVWIIEKNIANHVPGWGRRCDLCDKEAFEFVYRGINGKACAPCSVKS